MRRSNAVPQDAKGSNVNACRTNEGDKGDESIESEIRWGAFALTFSAYLAASPGMLCNTRLIHLAQYWVLYKVEVFE